MTGITNADRAEWATHALLSYATGKEGGTELYDELEIVLTDLLCDLRHMADRDNIGFIACLDRACMHYNEETTEPTRKPRGQQ